MWQPGANAVVFAESDSASSNSSTFHVYVAPFNGERKAAGTLTLHGTIRTVVPLGHGILIVHEDSSVRVARFPDLQSGKLLTAGGYLSLPVLSPDYKWMALSRDPNGNDARSMRVIDVLSVDGVTRKTVHLEFDAAQGAGNPQMLPGGREMIVFENPNSVEKPGVYLVNVAEGSAKKLFEYTREKKNLSSEFRTPDIAISPDGRQILYVDGSPGPEAVTAIDISGLLKSGSSKK
jgi:hypothetical protein